eukprot:scaffold188613_cov24-Tisochrysis_lutea.AAC.1
MGPIGEGRWEVVGQWGQDLWDLPQNFSGPSLQKYQQTIGFLGSSPVHRNPLGAYWVKGRVCVHDKESVPCGQRCGQQG